MNEEIASRRTQIDALDEEILRLINRRAAHAKAIGEIKDGAPYRPEREAQILRRIREVNPGPLSAEAVTRLFRQIMSECLALEKVLRVAYLGPAGTFSQSAALKHFGGAIEAVACNSIDEVARSAEAGAVDYAVVPVENSSEGAVGRTLDLMLQTPLKICGEVLLPIHQFLLRKINGLEGITRVYSHSQSLGQCQRWLNAQLPRATRIPVVSNAEAARLAAEDETASAVAGEIAADLYQLERVASRIEDEPNNTTRFWVLGVQDAGPCGNDKTSLVMSAKNRPGAVHQLLSPLARNGVSMSKLESRPSRTGIWEYMFFVDIEGHQQDEAVARSLAELKDIAVFLKILGSYPAAAV